jgi:3-oxoacyl-[acyl-carrier protein] reductase
MKPYAIITGASGDIGGAIAKNLADKGYDLALLGNQSKEQLEKTASVCENKGSNVSCFTGNLGDFSSVQKLMSDAMSSRKTVDLLVNCAGISYVGLLTDMSGEEWQSILNTNLSSMFYTCRFIVPHMVRQKRGRILNISSVWGNVGASCEVAYSAAKGGVNSFTKALAKELAPSGIAVNALACGIIDTKMNGCFSEEEIRDICEEIPAGRTGTPEEVAEMIALLAGAPLYLTGQVITMDGGWT